MSWLLNAAEVPETPLIVTLLKAVARVIDYTGPVFEEEPEVATVGQDAFTELPAPGAGAGR